MISRKKKWHLNQKTKTGTKSHNRAVMILTVKSVQNHILLITFEEFFNSFNSRFEHNLRLALFFLPTFGNHIKWKSAERNDKT